MSVCLVGSDMNYEAITFPPFPSATTVRYKNLLRNRRKITWKSLPKLDTVSTGKKNLLHPSQLYKIFIFIDLIILVLKLYRFYFSFSRKNLSNMCFHRTEPNLNVHNFKNWPFIGVINVWLMLPVDGDGLAASEVIRAAVSPASDNRWPFSNRPC